MDHFPTLKDEARGNTARISNFGRAMGENTFRLIVEPGLAMCAAEGEPDTRCGTCAGRPGTVPAGCMVTQADFLKAVMEDVPFMCHAHVDARGKHDRICHAWFAARVATSDKLPTTVPWPFSNEIAGGAP